MIVAKKHTKRWIAWLLTIVTLVGFAANALPAAQAAGVEHHVSTPEDLLDLAAKSQAETSFDHETIYLDADIDITALDESLLASYHLKHLTFGNHDHWFRGTFDGQGHTIQGLNYQNESQTEQNCGLISYSQNAVIRNLTIENAALRSVYQGGLVVGQAQNCVLENVTVLNSDLEIRSAKDTSSMITNGGFCGGAISGLLENSLMYNCEISGTNVHCKCISDVEALSGEGMHMGGLVGLASNSTIEYCRARSNYAPDRTVRQSEVSSHHDTTFGVLVQKSLYVGGIVGSVNNCSIYDCFSTAIVDFSVETHLAVAENDTGYGGGIAGALRGNSVVERCHYAGNISSFQRNSFVFIPIVRRNANISGIAQLVQDGSQIRHSYFRPSDIVSGAKIPASGGGDGPQCSPVGDEEYRHVSFWKERDFDFSSTSVRTTMYHNQEPHYNKWVMDNDLGIPVHGSSVAATFDFPEAGSVTIDSTMLVHQAVTTTDPFSFAIQGVHPSEEQKVTLTAALNDRYRLIGWYQERSVMKQVTDDIHKLLAITSDPAKRIPDKGTNIRVSAQDNDLFIAAVEAEVTFHKIDGTVLQDGWFRYEDALPNQIPASPGSGVSFYGWTTIPNSEKPGEMGYSAITSKQLNEIKAQNAFYVTGDPIEKEMDLYPIFVDSMLYVQTEFEGHDRDSLDKPAEREGVGYTEVAADGDRVYINAVGKNADGSFPDGYRFKGWYQRLDGGNEVCVSREPKYYLPEITEPVTYVARFEYEVTYCVKALTPTNSGVSGESKKYASVWYDYEEGFHGVDGPAFRDEQVLHWGSQHVKHTRETELCGDAYDANTKIVAPMAVYSHNYCAQPTIPEEKPAVYVDTDFPGSGKIQGVENGFVFQPTSEKYSLHFWTLESQQDAWTVANNPMSIAQLEPQKEYYGRAMVTAQITFHGVGADGTEQQQSVTRRYEDPILLAEDLVYSYQYPQHQTMVDSVPVDRPESPISVTVTSQKSPEVGFTDRPGYAFLGWISSAEVKEGSDAWNRIYNVSGELYCTSDIYTVKPYLITDSAKVYEAQDVYPVYAKYQIETTTTIHQLVNLPDGMDVNKPNKPTYTMQPIEGEPGKVKVTVTAEDSVTQVLVRDPEGAKYHLASLSVEVDGKRKELKLTPGPNQYSVTGEVIAGKSYRFIAHYNPLLIVYHRDEQNLVQAVVRETGETIGIMPEPSDQISASDCSFVGWTESRPESGNVHRFVGRAEVEAAKLVFATTDGVVKHNMDLWPVFMAPSVKANSNIDSVIQQNGENPEDVRSLQKAPSHRMQLDAKDYPGYKFIGWYTGYVDANNPGTEVTKERQFLLTTPQLFDDMTYTAVYHEAYQVTYHDLDGSVLHIENVEPGTRSFVDEQGNALDVDPILALEKKLGKNQAFSEWQWNHQGTMTDWNAFCGTTISQNMDLYPVICTVTATDSNDANYTGKLRLKFAKTQKIDPNAPADSYTLVGVFTEHYVHPFLTLIVKLEMWNPAENGKKVVEIQDLPTRMYVDQGTPEEQKYVEASQGPVLTDAQGCARHDFFGKLILKEYCAEGAASNQNYVRVVSETNQSYVIPVDVSTGSGQSSVTLPVGSYLVEKDSDWNWRDTVTITGVDDTGRVSVVIGDEHTVTIQTERINRKWFSGEDSKKNKKQ